LIVDSPDEKARALPTMRSKQMTIEELEAWRDEFEQFFSRFADLFERSESREQAKKYLWALLIQADRKTCWQIAEAVGDRIPDRMQRLLYRVPWDAEAARDRLQRFVIETFGDEEGIGVVAETRFRKKGRRSVGVAPQSLGATDKRENVQVATVLSYAANDAHVFLDRRLYLPQGWNRDQAYRTQARVPQEVHYATTPEQASAMLVHAWEQGVPMRWVTGDEVFGDSHQLRKTIQEHGRFYVLAVSLDTTVWDTRPELKKRIVEPETWLIRNWLWDGPGLEWWPPPSKVFHAIHLLSFCDWKWQIAMEEKNGPIRYRWVRTPVVENQGGEPGSDIWLLARRYLSSQRPLTYYLTNAPAQTPMEELVRVASRRSTVEQCIEEAKGETGLADYEVRYWHSWYRHITLSMMAHAWLASIVPGGTAPLGGG
jgi:SRSO17 transposase